MNDFEIALGIGTWLAIGSMALLYNNYPITPVSMIVIPFACVFGIYICMKTVLWLTIIAYYILTIMFRPDILWAAVLIFLISLATYVFVTVTYLVQQEGLPRPNPETEVN